MLSVWLHLLLTSCLLTSCPTFPASGDSCESCRNGNIELKQASSSRGVIPRAKIKTIKMTLTIVTGESDLYVF